MLSLAQNSELEQFAASEQLPPEAGVIGAEGSVTTGFGPFELGSAFTQPNVDRAEMSRSAEYFMEEV